MSRREPLRPIIKSVHTPFFSFFAVAGYLFVLLSALSWSGWMIFVCRGKVEKAMSNTQYEQIKNRKTACRIVGDIFAVLAVVCVGVAGVINWAIDDAGTQYRYMAAAEQTAGYELRMLMEHPFILDEPEDSTLGILRSSYDYQEMPSCQEILVGSAYRWWVDVLGERLPYNYSLGHVLEETPVSVFRIDAEASAGWVKPWGFKPRRLNGYDHPGVELATALLTGEPEQVRDVFENHLYSQHNTKLQGHYHTLAAQEAAAEVLEANLCGSPDVIRTWHHP